MSNFLAITIIAQYNIKYMNKYIVATLCLFGVLLQNSFGQAVPAHYQLRYAGSTNGAITFTGNSLGLNKSTGVNGPGALGSQGAFICINTNSSGGTYVDGFGSGANGVPARSGTTLNWTNNSSWASLRMPTNSSVIYAELIWGGGAQAGADNTAAGNVRAYLTNAVTLIAPDGTTNWVTPDPTTATLVTNASIVYYVRTANVTGLVNSKGAGVYAAGHIPATILASQDNGNACGWTLAVVYANTNLAVRSMTLYVADSFANAANPATAQVIGFFSPLIGSINARLFVSALEGDPQLTGDQMLFGTVSNSLIAVSGPNNNINNFFASQINQDDGTLDTSGSFGFSNSVPPAAGVGARQGWDITSVDVSSNLVHGSSTAYAQNTTAGDVYSLNALALQIDAVLTDIGVTVTGATNQLIGQQITYTITITNSGPGDAGAIVLTNILQAGAKLVSATGSPVNSGGVLTWPTILSITNGGVKTFTFTVTNTIAGSSTNSTYVSCSSLDQNPANNSAVIVSSVDTAPVAARYTFSAPKDVPFTFSPIPSCFDADGDPMTVTAYSFWATVPTTGVNNGVGVYLAATDTNDTFTVTPSISDPLTNYFAYTITDGRGGFSTNYVTIALTNNPPIAANLTNSVPANITSLVPVLPYCSDPNNDTIHFGLLGATPLGWTFSLGPGGYLSITPRSNYLGNLTISYNVVDSYGAVSAQGLLTFTITNQMPIANPDFVSGRVNSTITANPLANDSDPNLIPFTLSGITGVTNCSAIISGTNILITSATNFIGTAYVAYQISDQLLGTATGLITYQVTNQNPVLTADVASVMRGQQVSIPVLANDVDPDGLAMTIQSSSIISPLNSGNVSVNGTNVLFSPFVTTVGTVTLDYTVVDTLGSATSSITVQVTNGVITTPTYALATSRYVTNAIPVLIGASDPEGDVLQVIDATGTHGVATATGTNVLYASTNFIGSAQATYTLTDGYGSTNSGLVNITITNIPPVAVPDFAGTSRNIGIQISPLTNDYDLDGDIIGLVSIATTNGTATFTNNVVDFTPATNFVGTAYIGYTITDYYGGTNSALITVNVSNLPPVGVDIHLSGVENDTVVLYPTIFCSSPEGYTISLVAITASNANATVYSPTSTLLIPDVNFIGTIVAPFTIQDGHGGYANATLYYTVTNIPPSVSPASYSGRENTANVYNPLTLDSIHTPGGYLSIIALSPTNGTATTDGTNVTFTPSLNFLGTASVGYTITDNVGGTNSSLFTVLITNTPPTAISPINLSVTENTTNALYPIAAVTANTPGSTLVLQSATVTNGTVTLTGNNISFQPNVNFIGTAHVGYIVSDSIGGSVTGLFNILVTNIPPTAITPVNLAITENSTNTLTPLTEVTANTPGAILLLQSATVTNGTVTLIGNNISFLPNINFIGQASVGYIVSDSIGGTVIGLYVIQVTNIPPTALSYTFAITENTTNLFQLHNTVQTPGGTLGIVFATNTDGVATISGTNVVYAPGSNFVGSTVINYQTTDHIGGTNNGTITVTVTNIPPITVPDVYSVGEGTTNIFLPLANDSNMTPGGHLTIASVTNNTDGNILVTTSNITFTAALTTNGGNLVYVAQDNVGGFGTNSITVNVTNRPPVGVADSYTTYSGNPVIVTLANSVLHNDSDPQGLPLTAVLVSAPTNGGFSSAFSTNGTFTYTNQPGWSGVATFTYRPTDKDSGTNGTLTTVTLNVIAQADVAVNKTLASTQTSGIYYAGSPVTYNITVTNAGPCTSSNVVVNDQLPTGMKISSYTYAGSSQQVYSAGLNQIMWGITALPANTSLTFQVIGTVAQGGSYVNTAYETAGTYDPNPNNNDGASNGVVSINFTASADVGLIKTGPTNVYIGQPATYNLFVTNAGPSTATNVVVYDQLPYSLKSYLTNGWYLTTNTVVGGTAVVTNVIAFNLGTLLPGTSTNLSLTALMGNVAITNVAYETASTYDTNPTNNSGLSTNASVTTIATPDADVAVYVTGQTNIAMGLPYTLTVTVTNMGPCTASNIITTDYFSSGLQFVSASGGGVYTPYSGTNIVNNITWPAITLTNGGTISYAVKLLTTVASTNYNSARAAGSTADLNMSNNNGTNIASQLVTIVAPAQFSYVQGVAHVNPQTGLYEENISVTNTSIITIAGVRVVVTNLPTGITLYNATGTTNGLPYVEFYNPLNPMQSENLILQFTDLKRVGFTNGLIITAIIPPNQTVLGTNSSVSLFNWFVDYRSTPRNVIEFTSTPGKTYTIIYSDDLVNWQVATPTVTATANFTWWYDDGPPETASTPPNLLTTPVTPIAPSTARYYRVIQN